MKTLLACLALASLAPTTAAQRQPFSEETPSPRPQLDQELDGWRAVHGEQWQQHERITTGFTELLYGGSAEAPMTPVTEADWFTLGRYWVDASRPMHGTPGGQLVNERVHFLPLAQGNTTDKFTVRLRQEVRGVRVEDGFVNILMTTTGDLLSVQSMALPFLADIHTSPAVSSDAATENARIFFEQATGLPALETRTPELLIARINRGDLEYGALAWKVELLRITPDEEPLGLRIMIDALNGQVLGSETVIHYFDVSGTVVSNTTPGVLPDTAGNPETQTPMAHMRVTSSAGTVFTDANGDFNFAGVNSPLAVTVTYNGSFNNTQNEAGSNYSLTTTVQPNTPTTIVMNPSSSATITSQANAYRHVTNIRDWIRSVDPGDGTADFNATANVNISSTCNAFYDGGSTNYYLAGGSCVNTAYSTVVAHEMGHWMNAIYGTGNGSDGIGEGNADVWAMYVHDNPIVGQNFCGGGCNIRTGLNLRQYCGDCCGGCYGQVHADGEVWMGAAWKVRRNIKQTLGNAAGGAVADNLFLGWMNAYNQTTIQSIMEIQWLTLDDDDGNIANTTPNYDDIDSAFTEQGFPGYYLPEVIFTNVTELTTTPASGPFQIDATVSDNLSAVASVDLLWRQAGSSFQTVPMTALGADLYSAQIPAQPSPSLVEYYLVGTGTSGDSESYPQDAPNEVIRFGIGDEVTIVDYDFEAAGNEGWLGAAPGDDATTGHWERGNPIGTAAQPEDDVSSPGVNCWFTGQGSQGGSLGENDIDNGTTTLVSPAFDATGLAGVTLSYSRWYSNSTGASPNDDIFRIEASNDDGATWTTVETVGPGGSESNGGWIAVEVVLSEVLTETATMRLRFVASDLGSGSLVEAAIDEVVVAGLESSCPAPAPYCSVVPNSLGLPGTLVSTGSSSVAGNNLEILAWNLPAGQSSIFFYGPNQVQVPLGSGNLCVGGTIQRFPVLVIDVFGVVSRAIDLTALPQGDQITVGETVNFQLWHRDGSSSNLTNGLSATFCP